jgi:hypothetical protein
MKNKKPGPLALRITALEAEVKSLREILNALITGLKAQGIEITRFETR